MEQGNHLDVQLVKLDSNEIHWHLRIAISLVPLLKRGRAAFELRYSMVTNRFGAARKDKHYTKVYVSTYLGTVVSWKERTRNRANIVLNSE